MPREVLSSVRRVKKGPGRRPQSTKRQRFMELRARGWSILAAAREVGVSRTSGANWARGYKTYRNGEVVGFVAPLDHLAVREVSARYLSQDERFLIADLQREGASIRAIAAELGRAPSTISRELRRNTGPGGTTGPLRRTARPSPAGPVRTDAAWKPTQSFARWSAAWSASAGAHPRSPVTCVPDFLTGRRCGCVTRASTRPSTNQDRS